MSHSSHKIEKITGRPQTPMFESSWFRAEINSETSEERRVQCGVKLRNV
jgi:hypothetical protein